METETIHNKRSCFLTEILPSGPRDVFALSWIRQLSANMEAYPSPYHLSHPLRTHLDHKAWLKAYSIQHHHHLHYREAKREYRLYASKKKKKGILLSKGELV